MKDEDINKILRKMEIPEPDELRKKATIKAVVAEFHQQKLSAQKNFKEIEDKRRLTGKSKTFFTFLGEFAMKKSFVITGSATAFVALLIIGLAYFTVFIGKSSFMMRMSTEETPVSQEAGEQLETMHSGERETDDKSGNERYRAEDIILMDKVIQSKLLPGEGSPLRAKPRLAESEFSKFKGAPESLNDNSIIAKKAVGKTESRSSAVISGGKTGFHALAGTSDEYQSKEYKDTGRDKFETIIPNPVKQVSEEPVSTFSVDVDTAAYTFIRRELNHGVLPQKNAVRIEEMINYFDYDYSVPPDKTRPFQPTIAVYPTPWNSATQLLHIGIKGYDIIPERKPVSNLVFLIDVSGSMNSHDKLPLLKNSFRLLVNNLNEDDTVAIVVYAGAAGTVLEPTKGKEKAKILAALDQLQAGGSTAGGEGIRKAYELAEAYFSKDRINRVILATDGDFNVGIRDPEELKSFVERKRKTGIFLSVLGFGQGNYNDALMQKLAQNGNGNAAYIDNLNEARKVLVDEASSTLFTIAKDVKIQIEFNQNRVAEYRLIGYESRMLKREDFNNDKVDAGDIGSGHSVTALYEITPRDSKSKFVDGLRYSDKEKKTAANKSLNSEYAFLKIRYKLPDSEKSQLIHTPINQENEYSQIDEVPADIRFAASVAAFGQLLRGGTYTGQFTYEDIIKLAETASGKDPFGYRHEFINLVRLAESIR
ncbi:MAG: VWA domain-containing protein [Candidatus Scalindua sp.]|nr:VWA domain-containing protein [Candidatus Scalindua sp.]